MFIVLKYVFSRSNWLKYFYHEGMLNFSIFSVYKHDHLVFCNVMNHTHIAFLWWVPPDNGRTCFWYTVGFYFLLCIFAVIFIRTIILKFSVFLLFLSDFDTNVLLALENTFYAFPPILTIWNDLRRISIYYLKVL